MSKKIVILFMIILSALFGGTCVGAGCAITFLGGGSTGGTDIIAFIRQQALGSPLESNEERVKRAVARIKREYYLTKHQENWINRIEKVMLKEVVIDKETLDTGAFKAQSGGFDRLNEKLFNGKLGEIITNLKRYMFENKEIS